MRHTSVGRILALSTLISVTLACNDREAKPKQSADERDQDREGVEDEQRQSEGGAGRAAMTTCAMPSGAYQLTFELRDGSCGEFVSDEQLQIDNSVVIEKFPGQERETEAFVTNCTLSLKQTVRDVDTGFVRSLVRGATLQLNADSTVATGLVSLQRFDDAGRATCSGEYDAMLTSAGTGVTGAAATP